MGGRKIEEVVCGLARPILDRMGYELVDIEFLKEGGEWYLRIYIDKPGGILIEDCQAVSGEIGVKLDEADPIKQSYYLEVSSPGLERPLKKDGDFKKYQGEFIQLKLFKPVNGCKVYEGTLKGLKGNNIIISKEDGEVLEFDRNEVAIARRAIKF